MLNALGFNLGGGGKRDEKEWSLEDKARFLAEERMRKKAQQRALKRAEEALSREVEQRDQIACRRSLAELEEEAYLNDQVSKIEFEESTHLGRQQALKKSASRSSRSPKKPRRKTKRGEEETEETGEAVEDEAEECGVSFDGKKWRSNIMKDGKMRSLGKFVSEELAARAYDRAAMDIAGKGGKKTPPTILLSLTINGLYRLDSEKNEFECHHPGPLMCAITGSWTSFFLVIYDFKKEQIVRTFIGSGFVCGYVYHACKKPDLQAVFVDGYQPWFAEFNSHKDNMSFVQTVSAFDHPCLSLVSAHEIAGRSGCTRPCSPDCAPKTAKVRHSSRRPPSRES
jgi:hypothetical protein